MNKAEKAQRKKLLLFANEVAELFRSDPKRVEQVITAKGGEVLTCAHCRFGSGLCGDDYASWNEKGESWVVTAQGDVYINEQLIRS